MQEQRKPEWPFCLPQKSTAAPVDEFDTVLADAALLEVVADDVWIKVELDRFRSAPHPRQEPTPELLRDLVDETIRRWGLVALGDLVQQVATTRGAPDGVPVWGSVLRNLELKYGRRGVIGFAGLIACERAIAGMDR